MNAVGGLTEGGADRKLFDAISCSRNEATGGSRDAPSRKWEMQRKQKRLRRYWMWSDDDLTNVSTSPGSNLTSHGFHK